MYLVLYLTVVESTSTIYYTKYVQYTVQWTMNIFKSFHVSLAKKKKLELTQNIGSSSNFKMAPAPAKKPRLRNTGLNSYCSVLVTTFCYSEFVSYISKNIHLTYKIYLMFMTFYGQIRIWNQIRKIWLDLTKRLGSGSATLLVGLLYLYMYESSWESRTCLPPRVPMRATEKVRLPPQVWEQ